MDSSTLRNSFAYFTWAVVSVCALYVHYHNLGLSSLFWTSLALQLLLGGGILLAIGAERKIALRHLGLLLQALSAIALNFTMDESFLTIYTIVLAGQLPNFLKLRPAMLCIGLIMGSYYCVWQFYWHSSGALLETLLWGTFHLFSLFLNHGLNREQQQKEQAIAINQELKGTQSLLQEAAKQDERLRIARDLHDLLGHQLTALSIQLDVLRRSCPPPQQKQAESSYTLAQELLQSIRGTVSDLRDNHSLDISQVLTALAEGLPGIEVQEACTNTLKHAGASRLQISARASNDTLEAWVRDNGKCAQNPVPGNGFAGMAERMAAINGEFWCAIGCNLCCNWITRLWW